MKTKFLALAVIICSGIVVARSFGIWPFNGVVAVIRNTGSTNYSSCIVNVTGRSYHLGELNVGEALTANVSPTGESHIELDLTEQNGSQHHLVVDCYFERRGYCGTISVDIGDGGVSNVIRDVGLGFP